MKKEKSIISIILNWIIRIFWVFVIGSVFGFFVEMLYAAIYTRTIVIRQGLIYGPFIQIYGIGAVAYYILIAKIKDPTKAFFSGMLMGGILEYLCSFFQEIFFGTISWDYSKFFMNFNGRTCLLYCFYWGLIAIAFLKIAYPIFQAMEPLIYKKSVIILTIFMAIFMTFDITISCMAGARQDERHNGVPAETSIQKFLDKAYPDELLDRIYNNKIEM